MTKDQIKALEELIEHVEYVAGPDVDDVEDLLAKIATNSDRYIEALRAAIAQSK